MRVMAPCWPLNSPEKQKFSHIFYHHFNFYQSETMWNGHDCLRNGTAAVKRYFIKSTGEVLGLEFTYRERRTRVGPTWLHGRQLTVTYFCQSDALLTYRNVGTATAAIRRAAVLRQTGNTNQHHSDVSAVGKFALLFITIKGNSAVRHLRCTN